LQKILLIPDSHFPYVDQRAFDCMLNAAHHIKPDIVIIMGDFFDFYAVSQHRKDPRRRLDLAQEIAAGNAGLKLVEALGAKRKIFVEGNHEERLQRYLADEASDVIKTLEPAGLITSHTLPEALNLKKRGWEWVPYRQHLKVGKLYVTHDVGKAGANAHIDAEATFQGNVVIGHTHRIATAVKGNMKGKGHVAAMLGWLGSFSEIDYMHRARAIRDWAHGFGVAYMDEATEHVFLQVVNIVDYRCVIDGKVFGERRDNKRKRSNAA
jgi:predicted phosphodiesterase